MWRQSHKRDLLIGKLTMVDVGPSLLSGSSPRCCRLLLMLHPPTLRNILPLDLRNETPIAGQSDVLLIIAPWLP